MEFQACHQVHFEKILQSAPGSDNNFSHAAQSWHKKVVDMNCLPLEDSHIRWADYVFISAMSIQSDSVALVIQRCKALNKKIVAGGPLFTGDPESYMQLDHLILNEAEITLPPFPGRSGNQYSPEGLQNQ